MEKLFRKISRRLVCIIIIFLLSYQIQGTSLEKFLQANQYAMNCQWTEAANLYKEIEPKTDAIWYNLGVCSLEQGNLTEAIFTWLKVCRFSNSDLVIASLKQLERAAHELDLPQVALNKICKTSTNNFLLYQIVVLVLICLIVIFCVVRPDYRFKKALVWFLILLEIGIILGTYYFEQIYQRKYAVAQKLAELRVGPAKDYHVVNKLRPGQVLQIKVEQDVWCQVDDLCGQNGWLMKQDLLVV